MLAGAALPPGPLRPPDRLQRALSLIREVVLARPERRTLPGAPA
jgi:hypothetical protein